MGRKKRVLAAMSGGVDSSVSAAILKDQGYEVIGATLQVWDYSKNKGAEGCGTCCSHLDAQDAREVCEILNIPFYILNSESLFEEKVIQPFVESYLSARTPIPCADCNTFLKFHYLVQKMRELECDFLATGHYAEIKKLKNGRPGLFTSKNSLKDQSYFLFSLQPELLPKLLFPVGSMSKPEVRRLAAQKTLPIYEKKDSTGICFVGKGDYRSFVEDYAEKKRMSKPKKALLRLYPSGAVLGESKGAHCFTIGQRKGLGVSSDRALFVVKIDKDRREVWLGGEKDLYSSSAKVADVHWLDPAKPGETVDVKVRFRDKGSPARLYKNKDSYFLKFIQPKKALAPGQPAVFYRGRQVLGGGVIQESL